MGNAGCTDRLTVSEANNCDADEINGFDHNFCTSDDTLGTTRNIAFCSQIGDDEFIIDLNNSYGCFYNDANFVDRWDTDIGGCCSWECALPGRANDCKRIARRGLAEMCCFRDRACAGLNQLDPTTVCYDSNSELRSCPTNVQDLSSTTCQGIITGLCSNLDNDPTSQWRANWLSNMTLVEQANPSNTGGKITETISFTTPVNPVCLHALWRNVYGVNGFGCNGTAPPTLASGIQVIPTASGIVFGQEMVNNLLTTYQAGGGSILVRQDQQGDTELNDLIWTICSTTPGLCTAVLNQTCANVTTADIIANPQFASWCGCYMPNAEYQTYTTLFGIGRECTPQCNRPGVIPAVEADGITIKQCKQSTCIIDNIALDLYQTNVNGGIGINQLCANCSNASANVSGYCNCTLSNITLISADSSISSINLSQQCGNTTCTTQVTDFLGNVSALPVPCSGADASVAAYDASVAATNLAQENAQKWLRSKILLIFVGIIIVLAIIYFIFAPRDMHEGVHLYTRDQKSYLSELK